MRKIPIKALDEEWYERGKKRGKRLGAKKENKRLRKILRANYEHQLNMGNEAKADGIDFAINVIWSHKPKGKNK